MKVFKFGGASVKDAKGYQNISSVLQQAKGEHVVIVLSAMGKTTNAIETIARKAYLGEDYTADWEGLQQLHLDTINQLELSLDLSAVFNTLQSNLVNYADLPFDQYYDQTIPFGELLSTRILSSHLTAIGLANTCLDAGDLIRTDNTWREGIVDLEASTLPIQGAIIPALAKGHVIVPGFVGKYDHIFYTTLGREGSDYTGAILAHCLSAEGLWIWKDVPGVLTGDPKTFEQVSLLEELSYYEAIEMTYYGASVIHPKTIQPLRAKQIPLYVGSFLQPDSQGTVVHMDNNEAIYPPIFVLKNNQILISISTRDYTFMAEEHLSHLYRIFHECRVHINLLQTSALSLSVVVDSTKDRMGALKESLSRYFTVRFNEGLQLLTIRHYTEEVVRQVVGNAEPLLTQKSRSTIQLVLLKEGYHL